MEIVRIVEESVASAAKVTLPWLRVEVIPRVTELLADNPTLPVKASRLVRIIVAFLFFPGRMKRLVVLALMLKSGWPTSIVGPFLMVLFFPELSTISRLGMYEPDIVYE